MDDEQNHYIVPFSPSYADVWLQGHAADTIFWINERREEKK